MNKPKVRWSQKEREDVLREVARRMTCGSFQRGECSQLIRAAQALLPIHRRRPFIMGHIGPDLHQMEVEAVRYYQEKRRETAAVAPLVEAAVAPDPVLTFEQRVEELGREFAAAFVAGFSQELLASLRQTAGEAVSEIIQLRRDQGVEAAPLPRVLVIGTKQEWDGQLRRNFAGRLNLAFFNDKYGSAGLASECRKAAAIVMNGSMSRHSHQAVARASGKPFIVMHGAFSGLQLELEKLLPTAPEGGVQ